MPGYVLPQHALTRKLTLRLNGEVVYREVFNGATVCDDCPVDEMDCSNFVQTCEELPAFDRSGVFKVLSDEERQSFMLMLYILSDNYQPTPNEFMIADAGVFSQSITKASCKNIAIINDRENETIAHPKAQEISDYLGGLWSLSDAYRSAQGWTPQ